ncbi:MAG TPA: methylated-DNA--[protein]-cysteine S-methyltransferase [Candidatus Limnocylindrales bacterium]
MIGDAVRLATFEGPWGPYRIAVTGRGVVAAAWTADAEGFRSDVARRLRGRDEGDDEPGMAAARLDELREAVEAILAGAPVDVRDVPVDLADRPAFDRQVLEAVRTIGWGETASYGEVARRAGSPRAARAAGGAIGRNAISLLVPCHRVIAADGTLGGYGGADPTARADALAWKQELLLREGRAVRGRTR